MQALNACKARLFCTEKSGSAHYDAAKRDFTVRGGLVQKGALFEPEQLAEIYRALAFVREQDESLSFGRDRELAELMEQVSGLLPTDALRQRDAPERGTMTMK